MDITPLIKPGQQVIQSYSTGKFKVSGTIYGQAIIVFTEQTVEWNLSSRVEDLTLDDFAPLIDRADQVDVVLLGCGERVAFIPPASRVSLREYGIIIEVMDTGAACRTYNVLMAEGRRIAAAMLPV